MFSESALVRGDEKVPLYFAAGSMSAFSGTDITPESPNAKQTVWVNASTKDITSFAFRIHSVVHHGTINGTDITFASLPSGTDVTALTPAIVHDGASVSPSGPQNFSKPVVYTVKAVDGSEKSYTVTVLVEVKVIPVITEFVPWKGSGPATARIDADLEKFVRLTLNGQVVDPAHYTLASGSTIITLSEAYLKTLSNGTHVFTAEFTDGTATLPLVVDLSTPGTDSNTLPKTGDSGASLVLLAVLALATAGGGLLLLARRRLWSGELRDKEGSALSH
jgi:LPXTG-motif cell wall-anchored protein